MLYGISDEAKKLGYNVNIQDAGGYANVDKQVTQLSNLIVQKVKAILMDPADPTAFNGVVRQAKEAHIPDPRRRQPDRRVRMSRADGAVSSSHCNIGHELAKGAKTLLPNGGIDRGSRRARRVHSGRRIGCAASRKIIAGSNIKIVAEQTSEQDVGRRAVARQRLSAALSQCRSAVRR